MILSFKGLNTQLNKGLFYSIDKGICKKKKTIHSKVVE